MKKYFSVIICLLAILLCVTGASAAENFMLNNYTAEVTVGESYKVKAAYSDLTAGSFTFTSSDTDVAEVSADGLVTTKKAGFTTITVSDGTNTRYCTIFVNEAKKAGITLNCHDLALSSGATYEGLKATLSSDYTGSKIKWTSSDNTLVTVSDGLVTAASISSAGGARTATIRAELEDDSDVYDECFILIGTVNTQKNFVSEANSNNPDSILQYGYYDKNGSVWHRFEKWSGSRWVLPSGDGSCGVIDSQLLSNYGYDSSRVFRAPVSGTVEVSILADTNSFYNLYNGDKNSDKKASARLELIFKDKILKSMALESGETPDGKYYYATSYGADGEPTHPADGNSCSAGKSMKNYIGTLTLDMHKGDLFYMSHRNESSLPIVLAIWQGFDFKYTSNKSAEEIKVTEDSVNIRIGEIYDKFSAQLCGKEVDASDIEYISANSNVVTVGKDGILSAKGEGTARVYAVNRENELMNYVDVMVSKSEISVENDISYDSSANKISAEIANNGSETATVRIVAVVRNSLGAPNFMTESESKEVTAGGKETFEIKDLLSASAEKTEIYVLKTESGKEKNIYSKNLGSINIGE